MKKSLSTWRPLSRSSTHGHAMNEMANVYLPIRPMCGHFHQNHSDEDRGDLFVSPGSCAHCGGGQ